MTPSKSAALSTRSFDSFNIFKDAEYITGIQGLGTLQPLVDDREGTAYFGVKEESWKTCKWTATEKDFEKGTVLFDRVHTFKGRTQERMHCFIEPRLQIIHASEILVVDNSIIDPKTGKSKNIIVGDFSMEHIQKAFKEDQEKAERDKSPRRFSTRVKYLVNVLTKDNIPAHEVPIVLTVKGLVSVDLSNRLKDFYTKMEKCLSIALNMDAGVKFDNRFKSLCIFSPELIAEIKGNYKNEVCSVKNVKLPEYSDQETAKTALLELTVPDEARDATWKQLEDEFLADYINRHSRQEAAKLAGAYGIAEGVPALRPQGTVEVLPPAVGERDETGALVGGLT